jgi:hypothetical protein
MPLTYTELTFEFHDDVTVREMSCRGCGAPMGYSKEGQARWQRSSVYCSWWCTLQPPITPQQERNDLWRALHHYFDLSGQEIADMAGVLPSQVYRVL